MTGGVYRGLATLGLRGQVTDKAWQASQGLQHHLRLTRTAAYSSAAKLLSCWCAGVGEKQRHADLGGGPEVERLLHLVSTCCWPAHWHSLLPQ